MKQWRIPGEGNKGAIVFPDHGKTNRLVQGLPLISPLDHADKASAGSPIG